MPTAQDILSSGAFESDLPLIHFRGVFDLDGMYKMIYKWYKDYNYAFYETLHKAKPPELELELTGERKSSGYYKQFVDISFHFWGLKDVEVVVDGQKKIMQEARFTLSFSAHVKSDFDGAWETEKSALRAKLKYFYENYLIKKEILVDLYDPLVIEIRGLADQIKAHLGMEGS
jgi:hypothetical protein